MTDVKYDYSFNVWPHEGWGFSRSVFDVFRMFTSLICMEFTEAEFEAFRLSLLGNGFSLREVERVPHHEPESIT